MECRRTARLFAGPGGPWSTGLRRRAGKCPSPKQNFIRPHAEQARKAYHCLCIRQGDIGFPNLKR